MDNTIEEKEFAEKLGVVRGVLSRLRGEHLEPETDFVKKGREVLLTEEGAKKAAAILAQDGPDATAGADVAEAISKEAGGQPGRFWVVRVPLNPRVVMVSAVQPADWKKNGQGQLLLVRVHSNENFIPRMELKAKPSERGNVLVLVGRCPRWKGRY